MHFIAYSYDFAHKFLDIFPVNTADGVRFYLVPQTKVQTETGINKEAS
jgi:hypothetical protein